MFLIVVLFLGDGSGIRVWCGGELYGAAARTCVVQEGKCGIDFDLYSVPIYEQVYKLVLQTRVTAQGSTRQATIMYNIVYYNN